jgi:hypothetical protein
MAYLNAVLQYVQKYAQNPTSVSRILEAEIKFAIDGRAFENSPKSIASHLVHDTKATISIAKKFIERCIETNGVHLGIEQTMRFISTIDQESMIIHERTFVDGVQDKSKQQTIKKFKITHPLYAISRQFPIAIPYKITFASEEKCNVSLEEIMKSIEQVRLRTRLTISGIIPNWRIDITLSKALAGQYISDIKTIAPIKDIMFPKGMTPQNFTQVAPWDEASTIEIEAECLNVSILGDSKELLLPTQTILTYLQDNDTLEKNAYQTTMWTIAKLFGRKDVNDFRPPNAKFGIKRLSTQVENLTRVNWYGTVKQGILDGEFSVSDKPDGLRCIVMINIFVDPKDTIEKPPSNTQCKLITNELEVVDLKIVNGASPDNGDTYLVMDAERIKNVIYLFDVMVYNNVCITEKPYNQRRSLIPFICERLNKYKAINSIYFEPKLVVDLNPDIYVQQIKDMAERKDRPYESDGLIFTPIHEDYSGTIYKWKEPLLHNTIDFLIMKAPANLIGILPYVGKPQKTLYILFCGIRRELFNMFGPDPIKHYLDFFQKTQIDLEKSHQYFPIQFSPPDQPYAHLFWSSSADLSGKVGEFLYKPKDKEWILLRVREDRNIELSRGTYFGNDFRVALGNWRSYSNPLTFEELTAPSSEMIPYFTEDSQGSDGIRKFTSKIRYLLAQPLEGKSWLIDLGAGKGHMIRPCYSYGIKNVLFIDKDASALDILLTRLYDTKPHEIINTNSTSAHKHHRMNVYTKTMDLTEDSKDLIDEIQDSMIPIPANGVNAITCHFAIHYMCGSRDSIINLVDFMHSQLAIGGTCTLTYMDGKKVFDLLVKSKTFEIKTEDGGYGDSDCGETGFCITRKYKETKLLECGQSISVRLPFSQGRFYDEFLVNTDYLIKIFKSRDMEVSETNSFLTFENNSHIPITDNDRKYLNLMIYIVFIKKK